MGPISFAVPGRFPSLNEYIGLCRANPRAANAVKRREQARVHEVLRSLGYPDLGMDGEGRFPEDAYPLAVEVECHEATRRRDWDGVASMAVKIVLDAISRPSPRARDPRPRPWLIPDDSPRHVWPVIPTVCHDPEDPRVEVTLRPASGGRGSA